MKYDVKILSKKPLNLHDFGQPITPVQNKYHQVLFILLKIFYFDIPHEFLSARKPKVECCTKSDLVAFREFQPLETHAVNKAQNNFYGQLVSLLLKNIHLYNINYIASKGDVILIIYLLTNCPQIVGSLMEGGL
jgi:hypothetical protein